MHQLWEFLERFEQAISRLGRLERAIQRLEHLLGCKHHHVRLVFGPFSTGKVKFTMPATVECPQGEKFDLGLTPDPAGAALVGTADFVSGDSSLVSIQDKADGTGKEAVAVGAVGSVVQITGTDTGNGLSDTGQVTITAPVPPAETGVTLTFGTPHA